MAVFEGSPRILALVDQRAPAAPLSDPVAEVQVLGPYNSGTNLMFAYQRKLFEIHHGVHRVFGKHSLPPRYQWGGPGCLWSPGSPMPMGKIRKQALFVCMVRRPYFWLLSTCKRSYGITFLGGGRSFGDRIRCRVRFQDVRYSCLAELWNRYYRAYEEHLEPHRTVYVRLEDLVENPGAILDGLNPYLEPRSDVEIDSLISEVADSPAKSHGGNCVHGEDAKMEYQSKMVARRILRVDLDCINEQLDWRLMRKFGYEREDGDSTPLRHDIEISSPSVTGTLGSG